jgi:hypothetical protein
MVSINNNVCFDLFVIVLVVVIIIIVPVFFFFAAQIFRCNMFMAIVTYGPKIIMTM